MELANAPDELTKGLDALYLERVVRTSETYQPGTDVLEGHKRPDDPASAAKTLEELIQLTKLDMSVDMPLVLLDNMHPPCATNMDSLTKVAISDIRVKTRQRGSVLIARRIGVVTQTWSRLLAAVQDESGNTCLLVLSQHMRDVPADEFIPKGATLAIKEPYLQVDRAHNTSKGAAKAKNTFFVLRVDHPTDVVVLPPRDKLVPVQFQITSPGDTAASWKEKGNAAFARGRFLEAQRCYTEGIRLSAEHTDSPALMADLFRNRSRTGLSLHFYDDARSDALRSSSLLPSTSDRAAELNSKALFRAATAAYHLGDYEEGRSILGQLRELTPDDESAAILGKRIRLRLREQARGNYNFDHIRKCAEYSGNVDVASFLLRTEVCAVPINGMGLFATQDLKAGDIVFCEKAFVAATLQDGQTKPAHLITTRNGQVGMSRMYDVALWKNVVDKVTRNKSASDRFKDLAGTGDMLYTAPSIGADDDVFLMLERTQGNAHMMTHSATDTMNKKQALFVHGSQINHSCMPNTARVFVGDLLIVRASRAIRKGEQLFGSRTQLFDDFEQTRTVLSQTPKGHCECAICIAEQQTSPEQRVTRQETLKMATTFCNAAYQSLNSHTTKTKLDSLIHKGVQLANKLSATYDDNSFQGGMPRRGLATLYSALLDVHMMSVTMTSRPNPKEVAKLLKFPMQAIQAQGCKVAVDAAGNVSFANLYGVDNPRTEELLFKCAFVAEKCARYKTAKQFLGYAKEMHLLEHFDTADFPQELAGLEAMSV